MVRQPTDGEYITAGVPAGMLAGGEGIAGDDFPEGVNVTQSPGLTQIRIPAPANISQQLYLSGNPPPVLPPGPMQVSRETLVFDFPLLPAVQCHLELRGAAGADHLEQLIAYLTVAVDKIRAQERRKEAGEAAKIPLRGKKRGHTDNDGGSEGRAD